MTTFTASAIPVRIMLMTKCFSGVNFISVKTAIRSILPKISKLKNKDNPTVHGNGVNFERYGLIRTIYGHNKLKARLCYTF